MPLRSLSYGRSRRAGVQLALLLMAFGARAAEPVEPEAAASEKNCSLGAGTRFLGHLQEVWTGNDADSYFPVFSKPPVFVNGTDANFTEACRKLCEHTEVCQRWSFWHARPGVGGHCYFFPGDAAQALSEPGWTGGFCEGFGRRGASVWDKTLEDPGWRISTIFLCAAAALLLLLAAAAVAVRGGVRRVRLNCKSSLSMGNLQSECSEAWDAELGLRCPSGNVDPLARQPTYWGMTVQQLALFYAIHEDRLANYCRDHRLASDKKHVCLCADCKHDHGAASWRPRGADDGDETLGELAMTMHVVVDLVIKPFTAGDGGYLGYAPLLNKSSPLKPTVFVSHCWSELFPDFVATLTHHLAPTTVVWICSFALPQNMDINALIGQGDLAQSPFAQALLQAQRLFLVMDERLLPLDRVWCVYEMYLSTENQIRIDVRAPTMSRGLFRNILQKIEVMDIRKCSAASIADRDRIMSAVRGSEEKLNQEVRQTIEELVRLMDSIKD